jgi:hypothetical protein
MGQQGRWLFGAASILMQTADNFATYFFFEDKNSFSLLESRAFFNSSGSDIFHHA